MLLCISMNMPFILYDQNGEEILGVDVFSDFKGDLNLACRVTTWPSEHLEGSFFNQRLLALYDIEELRSLLGKSVGH